MPKYETKTIYFVCSLNRDPMSDTTEKMSLTYVHDQYQYKGYSTYEEARQWIERRDINGEYIILEVFKRI